MAEFYSFTGRTSVLASTAALYWVLSREMAKGTVSFGASVVGLAPLIYSIAALPKEDCSGLVMNEWQTMLGAGEPMGYLTIWPLFIIAALWLLLLLSLVADGVFRIRDWVRRW